MIPHVRLKYVQGLAGAHEELRLPCVVDLTTDGQRLIVSSPASGRPLCKLPLEVIERTKIESAEAASDVNRAAARLVDDEPVIVVKLETTNGLPPSITGQPIVFADPHEEDVTPRLAILEEVLRPRDEEEMAKLREGDHRLARMYAIAFATLVVLALLVIYAIQQLFAGPRPGVYFRLD